MGARGAGPKVETGLWLLCGVVASKLSGDMGENVFGKAPVEALGGDKVSPPDMLASVVSSNPIRASLPP
jgi:hypothetical protein